MIDQSDPAVRAAGLVVLDADALHHRTRLITDLVRETTDGAAMLWLAHSCAVAEIVQECLTAGLDDAVLEFDGGNLFARLPLHPPERISTLSLESDRESIYYFSLVSAWYDALAQNEPDGANPHERFVQAHAIASAWALPALFPLIGVCTDPAADLGTIGACRRVGQSMTDRREAMLSMILGEALQGRTGSSAPSATESPWRSRAECQSRGLEPVLRSMNEQQMRDALEMFERRGELETWGHLAELHGVDCPASPAN